MHDPLKPRTAMAASNARAGAVPHAAGVTDAPERPESVTCAKWRLYGYLVVGVAWYVRALPGGAGRAQPLRLPALPEPTGHSAASRAACPPIGRSIAPFDNAAWAREGGLHVALGAGFVGGLYRHKGFLEALDDSGIPVAGLRGISGTSAGAIVAAMCGTLPLRGSNSVDEALMSLHPQDFLDPEWRVLREQGAICSGNALVRKLERTFGADTRLQDARPPVRIGLYDLSSGETFFVDSGPLVAAVRGSAALPVLYPPVDMPDGRWVADGGIVDQHCTAGMPPGERAINHRIFDGTDSSLINRLTSWRIGRPPMHLARSTDLQHRTVHHKPSLVIHEGNFVDALQDRAMLAAITDEAYADTMAWLHAPAEVPSRA